MKTVDINDIERDVNDLLQENSSCQAVRSAIRDTRLRKETNRLVKRYYNVVIDEERTHVEPSIVSTYRDEIGELYAEDINNHMAILPKVVTPAAEISLMDIQGGDPGEPL